MNKNRFHPYKHTYGANQSEKVFHLREQPKNIPDRGKMEYLSGLGEVRGPRSYSDNREAQSMRHMSTVTAEVLKKRKIEYREVQVSINPGSKKPAISTNTNRGNRELKEIFNGETFSSFIELNKNLQGTSDRSKRHIKKLKKRHSSYNFSWLKKTPLVPDEVSKSEDGLHAERRNKTLFDTLNLDNTKTLSKGIKRRCAHCYNELKDQRETEGSGPGPEWVSSSASLLNAKPSEEVTHFTKNRKGKITVDYDTDSDSDG